MSLYFCVKYYYWVRISSVTSIHGTKHNLQSPKFLPPLHPASLLYFPFSFSPYFRFPLRFIRFPVLTKFALFLSGIRKANQSAHYILLYENFPNVQQICVVGHAIRTLTFTALLSTTDGCSICALPLYLWSMATNWKLYRSMYTKPQKLYISINAILSVLKVVDEKLVEKLAVLWSLELLQSDGRKVRANN